MNRIIAIVYEHDNMVDNIKSTINEFIKYKVTNQIIIFSTNKNIDNIPEDADNCKCININIPEEFDTFPKKRNWINSYFKQQGFNGKLHILEDNTQLLCDPTNFINELEHTMDVLEYDVWFSTICDTCNYMYAKYNPRLAIVLDKAEYLPLNLGKKLIFTSHSNTQWITYDFSRATDDQLHFDEDFTIPMFYIIEYLARRRNNKKQYQLYYMNQYLTVESEYKVFKTCVELIPNIADEKMQQENDLFKSKDINYDADNDIDIILETLYTNLNTKIQK